MLTLTAGDAELTLSPEIGAGVVEWRRRGVPMFRPTDPALLALNDGRKLASYPLVPFSNRIAGRRFSWRGKTYDLPEQFGGFAIHGVGWLREWTVAEHSATHAVLTLDQAPCAEWPFHLRTWQRFELGPDALVSIIGVENTDTVPWPAGIGQHPFFPKTDDVRLTFNAASVWHNHDTTRIPTHRGPIPAEWDHRTAKRVGGAFVDNGFAGWDGEALIEYPALGHAIAISASEAFRHTVYFVPNGQPFFAFEPVSHINDAINRMDAEPDHGLVVLQPGEKLEGRIDYRVRAL